MPIGASRTAEAVCFFRAYETLLPEGQRLLSDPYAEYLLPSGWQKLLNSPVSSWGLRSKKALSFGGIQTFVAVRHRWIDDHMLEFIANGGEQIVLLGAGYDARSLRFRAELGDIPILEIDFPATQAKKRNLLENVPDNTTAATYIPLDFECSSLEECLNWGIFDKTKKTFFIWEGVSMYLQPTTIDHTLETLRKVALPGSEIVCDIWTPPVRGSLLAQSRRYAAPLMGLVGEPFRFSIQPEEVAGYFADRGYETLELSLPAELEEQYDLSGRRIFPDMALVHAAIK